MQFVSRSIPGEIKMLEKTYQPISLGYDLLNAKGCWGVKVIRSEIYLEGRGSVTRKVEIGIISIFI